MSKNLSQVFATTPITVIGATDLLYVALGGTTDAGIAGASLISQFGVTPAALTRTNDTNVTLTLGGTPSTALLQATSLTLGWTGLLSLTRGGTNANLTASNGGIFYSTASAGAILAGTATANQILLSGSSTAPAWSTATYPATTTVNQLLYSSSANVIAGLATANNAVLSTGAGGIPVLSSTLPSGLTIPGYQASLTLPLTVPNGGTANSTFTAYSVLCAGTTATGAFQNVSGLGTSGYVLTSNGAGALPTWQAAAGGSSPWTAGSGSHSAYGGGATDGGNVNTLAWGLQAVASHDGSYIFADNNGAPSTDSGTNQLILSFVGGVFVSNNATITASFLPAGIKNGTGTLSNAVTGALMSGISNTIGASGNNATALGSNNSAGASSCLAAGHGNSISSAAPYAIALGNSNICSATETVAMGTGAHAVNAGSFVFSDSQATGNTDSAGDQFVSTFAGGYFIYGGQFALQTVGSGLSIKEGSNAKQGVATLSSGSVVVSNTSVTANSRIFLTAQDNNTIGALRVSARTASTSFTITSTVGTDSGVVAYEIFEPA